MFAARKPAMPPTIEESFARDGYAVLPGFFSAAQIDKVRADICRILAERRPI
jgi:hypothetical protein